MSLKEHPVMPSVENGFYLSIRTWRMNSRHKFMLRTKESMRHVNGKANHLILGVLEGKLLEQ